VRHRAMNNSPLRFMLGVHRAHLWQPTLLENETRVHLWSYSEHPFRPPVQSASIVAKPTASIKLRTGEVCVATLENFDGLCPQIHAHR
jgi:hypothetical protein